MALVWTSAYSNETAQVGRIGTLQVNWETGGFRAIAFGVKLKPLFPDRDDAKQAVIRAAYRHLDDARAALG